MAPNQSQAVNDLAPFSPSCMRTANGGREGGRGGCGGGSGGNQASGEGRDQKSVFFTAILPKAVCEEVRFFDSLVPDFL